MTKTPDSIHVLFIMYCTEKASGRNDMADMILSVIHAHDFDVRIIQGKWCLVKKNRKKGEQQ